MLIDSSLTLAAGLIAAGSKKEFKSLSVVIFVSFAMLQICSDIFLKILNMTGEPAIYVAYSFVQVFSLIAFIRFKADKILKTLLVSTLIANAFAVFHYIVVTNFGEMSFDFHIAYNPIVWSLMIAQVLYLLWIEKNVVTCIRKQGYILYTNSFFPPMVRILRGNGNANRGVK